MRTVFNVLGPLTNPAGATAQVIGVFVGDGGDARPGLVWWARGTPLVVHGAGHDEIVPGAHARVEILEDVCGRKTDARRFWFQATRARPLAAGGQRRQRPDPAADPVGRTRPDARRRGGQRRGRPVEWQIGAAGGRIENAEDARRSAEDSINTGAARDKLEKLVVLSNAPLNARRSRP